MISSLTQATSATYEELLPQFLILQKENISLTQQYETLQGEYALLKAQVAQLKRMIFGAKSERFVPATHPSQIQLPLNIEPAAEVLTKQQQITYTRTSVTKKANSNHQGRLPLPAHLPRMIIELQPQENVEGCTIIGEEITEELDYAPGKFFVNKYIRKKYAAKDSGGIITAALPSRPIDKGIPAPGLLAQIIVDKYVDHLPLYRQQQRFIRENIHISDSTLSDWVRYTAALLRPLYEVLVRQVLSSGYLMADESPIKVLDRNKKRATHQGWYWVYRSPLNRLVFFEYQEGRGRDGPVKLLKNYKGFLQTDGYVAYDIFENKESLTLAGCMAHARRYFDKALDNDAQRAGYALELFRQLYAIERTAKEKQLSHEQRYELRQRESVPLLRQLEQWLKENLTQTLPKSAIGTAISYTLARWDKLTLYAQHGLLEIDNNPVENAIRPLALGRKNYLFAGSHDAAQRGAVIYSLLGSCKINTVNPFAWLKATLTELPQAKVNDLIRLLPIKKS